jgi:hypothetical protein
MKNNRNYWSKEKCHERALKYNSRKNFRENEYCYQAAFKNEWLDDICSHMEIKSVKPSGYWSKDKCHEIALKYNNRNDFKNENKSAYTVCCRNGWLNDVCYHLKGYKPHGYWTKEHCQEEALRYELPLH